jgi:hypothetical protein
MEQALQKNKQRQKWKKNKYSENKNSSNRDITGNTGNLLSSRAVSDCFHECNSLLY